MRHTARPTDRAAAASLLALLLAACGREGGDEGNVRATTNAPAATSAVPSAAPSAASPAPATFPPLTAPRGPWHVVAQDASTLVAVDTSTVAAQADGEARVRIRYLFAAPQPIPGRPGVFFRAIESQEVTECARATSHPSTAILLDSAGREIARATSTPGPQGAGMIGNAGGALCAYLRGSKKVR